MNNPDIEHVRYCFLENFSQHGELGASLSVWQAGKEIINLADGFQDRRKTIPWTSNTSVLVWSATKGLSAACLLHCLENQDAFHLDTKVSSFWPEFGAHGKQEITIGNILSHRAGVSSLKMDANVFDHHAVVAAIEQENKIEHDEHAYHPRTFGFLLDEILRRISGGITLGNYWRQHFAKPLALDFWIGELPDNIEISPVFPPKTSAPPEGSFYKAFGDPESLTFRSFTSPRGLHSVAAMNSTEARKSSFPAFGGIGTASALGKFYAMLAHGGRLEGRTFFEDRSLRLMTDTLSSSFDRVLQIETAFSAGFMKDPLSDNGKKLRSTFGPSLTAFGHPGAGGSVAFADPENDLSFAYVMNQMEPGVLPNQKAISLVQAVYGEV